MPLWSSWGDSQRAPDLVAPGQSIVSLRAPGSLVDQEHPEAVVGDTYLRGSGTSQSAAFVPGAAALIVAQRPGITPDGVKALLTRTAQRLPRAHPRAQGAGLVDLKVARDTPTPAGLPKVTASTGLGTLEGARGTDHLEDAGVVLQGEQDIFRRPWSGVTWASAASAGTAFVDGTWLGVTLTGAGLAADGTWEDAVWASPTWSGSPWSTGDWTGSRWSGSRWSGSRWSGSRWSGSRWSNARWGE